MSRRPDASSAAEGAADMHMPGAASPSRPDIEAMLTHAIDLYRVRVIDNIDLSKLPDAGARARVVARALMERGDARAFVLGRKLLAASWL